MLKENPDLRDRIEEDVKTVLGFVKVEAAQA
jgi:hypothetical protein